MALHDAGDAGSRPDPGAAADASVHEQGARRLGAPPFGKARLDGVTPLPHHRVGAFGHRGWMTGAHRAAAVITTGVDEGERAGFVPEGRGDMLPRQVER